MSEDLTFKVVEDGAAKQESEYKYESLGERSFQRTQKYLFTSKGAALNGILAVRGKQIIGKKSDDIGDTVVVIRDGRGNYDCRHYYTDIPLKKPDDEVSDPICKFEITGFAKLQAVQTEKIPG